MENTPLNYFYKFFVDCNKKVLLFEEISAGFLFSCFIQNLHIYWQWYLIFSSCPYLIKQYHFVIAILNGILTLFVIIMFAQATFTDPGYYPRGKWALGLCIFEFYCQYQLASAINLDQSLFNISDSDKHNVVHGNHLFQSVYWSVPLNVNLGVWVKN